METNTGAYSSRLALSNVAECFASLFYTLGFPKVAGKLASVARLKRIVEITFTKAIIFNFRGNHKDELEEEKIAEGCKFCPNGTPILKLAVHPF